jgi:hypothetical protein
MNALMFIRRIEVTKPVEANTFDDTICNALTVKEWRRAAVTGETMKSFLVTFNYKK